MFILHSLNKNYKFGIAETSSSNEELDITQKGIETPKSDSNQDKSSNFILPHNDGHFDSLGISRSFGGSLALLRPNEVDGSSVITGIELNAQQKEKLLEIKNSKFGVNPKLPGELNKLIAKLKQSKPENPTQK